MTVFALIVCLGLLPIRAQDRPVQPSNYKHFDEAQKNAESNMCPYLIQGSKRIPVICWMCHFPHGMNQNNQYTYDCCPGYVRSELANNECVGVESSWKNMITYLKDKGQSQTAEALTSNTAIPELNSDTPTKVYTAFVPKEDSDITHAELDYTGQDNSARMLLTRGRVYSSSFVNGRTILNENKIPLKISTYSNGLTFIECRLFLGVDHETTSGVVHFIDGALPATNRHPTVLSRLKAEPELSQFVDALPQDMRSSLDKEGSSTWYTVIAPTNKAWNEAVRKLNDAESVATLARNHILPRMICSGAIRQKSQPVGPMYGQDYVRLTVTNQNEPAVLDSCNNQIPFLKKDLMAGNGVVHIVDKALIGIKALGLSEALDCLARDPLAGLGRAVKEMKQCGVVTASKANIILVPHEDAYRWLDKNDDRRTESNRMKSDSQYRCNVYAYHLLRPNDPSSRESWQRGFTQGQQFRTDYTAPNGKSTFVSSHYIKQRDGSKLSFNSAQTNDLKPIKFRDGLIYPIRTINFPPRATMMEILQSSGDLTITTEKAKASGIESEWIKQNGKVLFLAPTNMGWSSRDVENAYSNSRLLKFFRLHTIPHLLFGGENGFLPHSTVQTVDSLLTDQRGDSIRLTIKRGPDGNTFIGYDGLPEDHWAMVLDWNMLGTDGIVWLIDWPIRCPDSRCS